MRCLKQNISLKDVVETVCLCCRVYINVKELFKPRAVSGELRVVG